MAIAVFYVVGLLAGAAAALDTPPHTVQSAAQSMLRYFLPVGVGAPLILAFFGHVFRSELAARRLGWPAGNPFQWEVGFWDGAVGVAAIVCFWRKGDFWLAAVLINVIFWTLAAGLHCWHVIHRKNYSIDNVAAAIADVLVAATLVVLYGLGSTPN